MLEKLYTRKVVIALMALILAANGLLLYEFQIKPPTQTANAPSSEGSPRIAETPRQEEEAEEEDGGEDEPESPDAGAPRQGSGGGEEPPDERPPPQGAVSPETPFGSQYNPPPTVPGSESATGSSDGGSPRIRVALASFYDSEGGVVNGSGDSGGTSILPTTSGGIFLPAAMFVGVVAVAAVAAAAALRRR